MNTEEIQFNLEKNGRGAFFIGKGESRIAEMEIGISGQNITVYHTEVDEELRGHGIAGKLLNALTAYARNNHLKVIPLCPYVSAQFSARPDEYADIWNKNWRDDR